MNILSAEKISKSFGMKTLFTDLTFGIGLGEKIGLIGVNGTGKSTLIKILVGREQPDSGLITKANQARIGYLSQTPSFAEGSTVLDAVIQGSSPELRLIHEYEQILQATEDEPTNEMLQKKLLQLTEKMDRFQAWGIEHEAKNILTKLGITDFSATIDDLSGGQRKRVTLAAALIDPVELLILDEPTNHIDNQTIDWLEEYLKQRSGALLMVTHDRYFLDRVTDRIFELDHGKLYTYSGNYSLFLEKKAERVEQEAATAAKRENLFRRELSWIRRGAKARSTKQQARIDRFETLQKSMENEETSREIEILAGSSRLGKKIVALDQVEKEYDGKPVINGFSYIFGRNDRVGVVGPNGAGKSTLLNLIAGNIQPDQGRVEVGPTVKFGFFTQECATLNEELRVIDYIKEQAEFLPTADGGTISATQMLERFLFPSNVQYSPIAKLSGGERRRLFLLRVLMGAPNVLLLDEPTNDLDIQTLSILEDYLEDFPGVVIAASHDRYFLDRVAEKIIAFEEDGKIHCTAGNYSYYREERERLQGSRDNGEELKKNNKPKTGENNHDEKRAKPNKLSYMEQREYDGIETVIAEVEERLSEVKKAITRSGSDYQRLQELTQTQEEFEKRLEKLLERWTYLSELVESYQKK